MRAPLLLITILLALAGFLGWRYVVQRRATTAGKDTVLLETVLEDWKNPWRSSSGRDTPAEASLTPKARFLTEAQVRAAFAAPEKRFAYDPVTYFRYAPNLWEVVNAPHLPSGVFDHKTNGLGVREELQEIPGDRDLFVLVTGDIHVEGLCDNAESFPNRLQAMIQDRHRWEVVEVWNAAIDGYTLYNYLGVLETHLAQRPDVFVVAINGADDFLETAIVQQLLTEDSSTLGTLGQWKKRFKRLGFLTHPGGHAIQQAAYFHRYPEQVDRAFDATAQICESIIDLCRANDVVPIFLYLPPGFDPDSTNPFVTVSRKASELSEYDLHVYDRLASSLLHRLSDRGVDTIDMRKALSNDLASYYTRNLILNTDGYELIARLLLPRIEAIWKERS